MTRFFPLFFKRWLQWLLEFTPAVRRPAARLLPKHQIEHSDNPEYCWRSTGDDPQFAWKHKLPAPGWYMLEVVLRHNQPLAGMRVYFNIGSGFDEAGSFYLQLKAGRLTKRLCRVPRGVTAVRIDPMESGGDFTFAHLRFARVSGRMAMDRLVRRLVNMHLRWQDVTPANVLPAIQAEAGKTGSNWLDLAAKYYEETFARMSMHWSYPEWLARNGTLDSDEVERRPDPVSELVEVLLAVDEPERDLVRRTVHELEHQVWGDWRLKVIVPSGLSDAAMSWFEGLVAADDRSSLVLAKGAVVEQVESELWASDADWVVMLEPGDTLARDAVWWVCSEAGGHGSQCELLYSDEDCLDDLGGRFGPSFRPQWNPDYLLSRNYVGKALWVRPQAVCRGMRRWGSTLSGLRYGLLLQLGVAAGLSVLHVPRVLVHGRRESDAQAAACTDDCRLVLDNWLQTSVPGAAVQSVAGGFRVVHPTPEVPPKVSLLVPTRNGVEILQPCVDAILDRTRYPDFEVLILDNESDCPRTLAYMETVAREDSRVRVLRWDYPFNYSAINNFGAQQARGEVIGLINNDIEPINGDWLWEMVSHVVRPEVGCVGAKLYYPSGIIQHGGVILGIGGVAGHAHKYLRRDEAGYEGRLQLVQNLSAVTGACLLVRKEVFDEVGGLEEDNLAVAFNDVDFCLRVREAGYRNLWTPFAEAYHHESVSRGADDTPEKRDRANREAAYMKQRWGKALLHDPAYNPNLTLIHEDFSLR
ncbi:glycosyltransferase family 2 protein [Marinobacter vinifirmus]|uniref:Glycosyltransferase n=1 Tax=Marinobacter vinifirmus TaxID=355591 RepID=A0A558B373_9GAMM|nr:glycosyltransferase family 2 protein [Marinobacter vinifirmus]TVT30957.1 MAG: glycosyltransferase [Marinobacter vinifirmus]